MTKKTKFIFRSIKVFILILLCGLNVKAESLQDAFRYSTYGIVAGALAGGASMAFAEDPGSSLKPVAQGASLGLYAGLIVAVFKNLNTDAEKSRYDVIPVSFNGGGQSTLGLALTARF